MKIQPLYLNNNFTNQQTFKGMHVIDSNVQKLLLTTLEPKQLDALAGIIKEQQNNSVHVLLDSKNGRRLKASLFSAYRLKDLKEKYEQIPVLESKFHFIKRIAKIANKYKEQVKDFEVLRLNWDYSMLPEWKSKMYL
ncbi:hypothetical protein HDR58_01255 [bacterium]|nr:hypothetical protein [bacterium]